MRFLSTVLGLATLILASCGGLEEDRTTRLLATLEGEWDSGQHMQVDAVLDLPEGESHGWVNRHFMKIDAPALGEHVLIATVRYGGDAWRFDENEFLIWTFEPGVGSDAIVATPRRPKLLKTLISSARDAAAFTGITAEDLEPAISGSACPITWRETQTGFAGQSAPCSVMSTTQNTVLAWTWNYNLKPDILEISFSGTDEKDVVRDGSPPGVPYLLNRIADPAEYVVAREMLMNPADRGDPKKAAALLVRALDGDPGHLEARLWLAYAHIRSNQYNAAADVIAGLDARALNAEQALRYEAIQRRLADDLSKDPLAWQALAAAMPDNRWAWYEVAVSEYRASNYAAVVTATDKALALEADPRQWDSVFLFYLKSKALFRMDKYNAAITAAEPGLEAAATRRSAFYRQAMAQVAAGQRKYYAEILKTYRAYSASGGTVNTAVLFANFSLFHFELGQYDAAVDFAEKAYALEPGAYQAFALGYAMTELGQASEALDILRPAARTFPKNVNILAANGWAHYRLGDLQKADALLKAAQAASKRKNTGVERDLAIVQTALKAPGTDQVASVRWFGD